ncbi:MAG: phage virion morphogenesis protein, partial [Pseudomonadota bacterium]
WAPKTAATLAAYARGPDRFDTRPLIKTGTMRRTIFYQATATTTLVASNAIQAAVMQGGAAKGAFGATAGGVPIPFGNIPARPFIGLSEEDEAGIVAIVEEWLTDIVD